MAESESSNPFVGSVINIYCNRRLLSIGHCPTAEPSPQLNGRPLAGTLGVVANCGNAVRFCQLTKHISGQESPEQKICSHDLDNMFPLPVRRPSRCDRAFNHSFCARRWSGPVC